MNSVKYSAAPSRAQGHATSTSTNEKLIAAKRAEIARRYDRRQEGQLRIARVAAKRIRDLESYLERSFEQLASANVNSRRSK
ncbi:hypothetical protein [Bradyrhizobium sp. HKCCYLR20261]|uniref:hypothetical protein n=1 Tax=Bradyrhizobium sp. HKCCYLR20261 TaxID=3420760 RepID=UPI003EC119F7